MNKEKTKELPEALVQTAAQPEQQFTLRDEAGERSFALPQVLQLAQQALDSRRDVLADTPQLRQLLDAYPELTELPQPVEEEIRAGKSPLEAYRAYENAQLKQQLHALQQQEKNSKAPGAQSGDAEEEQLDALMAIFNSVFQ